MVKRKIENMKPYFISSGKHGYDFKKDYPKGLRKSKTKSKKKIYKTGKSAMRQLLKIKFNF